MHACMYYVCMNICAYMHMYVCMYALLYVHMSHVMYVHISADLSTYSILYLYINMRLIKPQL